MRCIVLFTTLRANRSEALRATPTRRANRLSDAKPFPPRQRANGWAGGVGRGAGPGGWAGGAGPGGWVGGLGPGGDPGPGDGPAAGDNNINDNHNDHNYDVRMMIATTAPP